MIRNFVTLMPNQAAFQSLYPWSQVTNYGDQYQYTIMDTRVPAQTAYMAQNCMNPMFWAQYNLQQTSMPLNVFSPVDAVNQQSLQNAYDQGYQLGESLKLQGTFSATGSDIASFKVQVEQLLNQKDLPADKKAELQNIKKQIEAVEKKYQEAANKLQARDVENAKAELEAIKGELITLKEAAKKIAESLPQPSTATDTTTQTPTGTDTTTTTGGTSTSTSTTGTSTSTTGDDTTTTATATDTQNSEAQQAAEKQKLYNLNQICHMLDKAMDGLGTDYDGEKGMKTVLEALVAPDNVIELWDQWNKTYGKQGSYASDDDGFIETLMDECEGDQKEEIATILIDAMEQRAIAAGIDVDTEVAAARNAIKSNWIGWRSDDNIQAAMLALYNKLKA